MSGIRLYQPNDLADVYDICVKTGDSGADATGVFHSDELLGDVYAAPYVTLEPESAWVVDTGDRVAGYLVATADTRSFVERYRTKWLPGFAEKYPHVQPVVTADAGLIDAGYTPEHMINADIDAFPAHLHIDLLPELQGQGLGRTLIRTLLAELNRRGVPGVQLGVGEKNHGARAFYARLGFRPLPSTPNNELALGIRTDAEV